MSGILPLTLFLQRQSSITSLATTQSTFFGDPLLSIATEPQSKAGVVEILKNVESSKDGSIQFGNTNEEETALPS